MQHSVYGSKQDMEAADVSAYNFIFQVTVQWKEVNIEENGWLEMNEKKENVLQ